MITFVYIIKIMNRFLLINLFVLASLSLFANSEPELSPEMKDNPLDLFDINKYLTKDIQNKFPSTRLFNASYQLNTPSDYRSKLYGAPYEKGQSRFNNLALAANVPFYNKGKKLILMGVGRYNQDLMVLKDVKFDTDPVAGYKKSDQLRYYSLGLNATYLLYYKQKLVILNATILGEGGTGGFQTARAYLYASYALKKTKQFNMTVGLVAMLGKQSPFPVIPTFTLSYQLANDWQLDLFLPKSIFIRKTFLNNRISFGTDLDSQTYFFRHRNDVGSQKTYVYRENQIKTGALFEHQISERFIVSLSAGLQNTFGGKLIPKNKSRKDDIMTRKVNANFYLEAMFSVNF